MPVVSLGTNLSSLIAQRYSNSATDVVRRSTERLSSGMRINRPSDDAASLAVATTLGANARVFSQGLRNISDGQSALAIADGGLEELSSLTTRLKELAEQAANGSFSRAQRLSLQSESDALTSEFNRLISTTSFNGQTLLDGRLSNMRIQGGYGVSGGVAVNLTGELSRNVSSGTYTTKSNFSSHADIASADLNGDGKIDIIGAASTDVKVSLGNGDGTFATPTLFAGGGSIVAIALGDVNADGKLDAIAATDTSVKVLRGNGDGTFGSAVTYASSIATILDIEVGDFNNDGKTDIIAGGSAVAMNNKLQLFTQNAGGTLTVQTARNIAGFSANQLRVGDVNDDGRDDVTFAGGDFGVQIYLTQSDYSFKNAGVTPPSTANEAAFGDFNRDGLLDIAVSADLDATIFLGNGDGTFRQEATVDGIAGQSMRSADMNGDGLLDLVDADGAGTVTIALGNGDGSFENAVQMTPVLSSGEFTLNDFNNDGVLDLAGNRESILSDSHLQVAVQCLNLATQRDARAALDTVNSIFNRILLERANLGASQSRLSAAWNALLARRDGTLGAESRLVSSDVAEESAQLTRGSILQQTAQSVLAQANQSPKIALSLLQF